MAQSVTATPTLFGRNDESTGVTIKPLLLLFVLILLFVCTII